MPILARIPTTRTSTGHSLRKLEKIRKGGRHWRPFFSVQRINPILRLNRVDLVEFYSSAPITFFAKSFHRGPDLLHFRRSMIGCVVIFPGEDLHKEWSSRVIHPAH